MNNPSSILVGCTDDVVSIRVGGKGTFLNSAGMKQFALEMVNRGHREFIVDLRLCPVMDSTFMGTLAGIALRLRELGQGQLHVINLNQRNSDLLRNLGLDHLFTIDLVDADACEKTAQTLVENLLENDSSTQAKTMLEAHEALVEASPENLTKFKDVLEYLKQDLHLSE